MIIAAGGHIVVGPDYMTVQMFSNLGLNIKILVVVAILFASLGGLMVAAILKRLDNIVKEYSSATANTFTAILCAMLFPDQFTLTVFIFISMLLLFTGIYLYEIKADKDDVDTQGCKKVKLSNIQGDFV